MDAQEYLLQHLFLKRTAAHDAGDEEAERDAKIAITAVQKHSPSHGVVDASASQTCVECGPSFDYPCVVLKTHARQFRGVEGFPSELEPGRS
jgi:hypothetical protein